MASGSGTGQYQIQSSGHPPQVSRAWRIAGIGAREQLRLVNDHRHQWTVVHKTDRATDVNVHPTAKDALTAVVNVMRTSGSEWVEINPHKQ